MYPTVHGSRLRDSLSGYQSSGPGIPSVLRLCRWLKSPLYAPNALSCSIATSCRNCKKQLAMKGQHCPSPTFAHTLSIPPARRGALHPTSRRHGNTTFGLLAPSHSAPLSPVSVPPSLLPHSNFVVDAKRICVDATRIASNHSSNNNIYSSSNVSNITSNNAKCGFGSVAATSKRHTCIARARRRGVASCFGGAAVGMETDSSTSSTVTSNTSSHANSIANNSKSSNNAHNFKVNVKVQMGPALDDHASGTQQPNDEPAEGADNTSAASAAAVASVAAVAVAGAIAAAVPAPPPRTTAVRLLRRVVDLLREHFAAVMLLYAVKDAVAFLLHRVTQRLTNHAAELLLGTPTSTVGNPWWLYLDPAFIRAHPGYEVIVGLFFLASLPLTIALNSVAFTAAALIATPPGIRQASAAAGGIAGGAVTPSLSAAARTNVTADDTAAAVLADLGIVAQTAAMVASGGAATPVAPEVHAATASASAQGSVQVGRRATATDATGTEAAVQAEGPGTILRDAAAAIAGVLPSVFAALRRVWMADLQLNVRALPLQGLCLLVLPALWAAPRLLRLQLTLPVAVLEGRPGREALGRSEGLMTSSLGSYGLPFAGLLAAGRMLEYVQGLVMVMIPPRWWREVVEVPLAIAGSFLLLKAAANRLQDLLPLAAYLELSQGQAADAARQELQLLTPHTSKLSTANPTASNALAADAVNPHATSLPAQTTLPTPPQQSASNGFGNGGAVVEG